MAERVKNLEHEVARVVIRMSHLKFTFELSEDSSSGLSPLESPWRKPRGSPFDNQSDTLLFEYDYSVFRPGLCMQEIYKRKPCVANMYVY